MYSTDKTLELNRKHIAGAFTEYCRRKNHGQAIFNVVINKQVVSLGNITEAAVINCLIHTIEIQCLSHYGRNEGVPVLVETYQSMLNKDNSRLTSDGVEFMNEVMKTAVSAALENPKDNNFGLEIYHA